jgi:NAD(P)H-flavin reductase
VVGPTAAAGPSAPAPEAYFLPRAEVDVLISALRAGGREVNAPTLGDGTIVLDEVEHASELPAGWGLENAPGRSRLIRRSGERVFDQPPGPTSWKRWTFPPRVAQIEWIGPDGERRPQTVEPAPAPKAFLGVRACEIAALRIQDRVLAEGPVVDSDYVSRRADNLIVAVECAVAGSTCFCTSMGTGPEVTSGFDIALSELDDGFVVRVGSPTGAEIVDGLGLTAASEEQRQQARSSVASVRAQMGQPLPMDGLPERLIGAPNSPRWAEVAQRCLACANCTLVCPTCFCTGVSQRSELDGQAATAERSWDSCFTLDFARVAGGNFRPRVEDRYRQWLTHKFGTWWTQFGTTGCVGCGRCVTWCPVGIDVREELMAVAGPVDFVAPLREPIGRPPLPLAVIPSDDGHLPWVTARVSATHHETADVVTLRLATDDPRILAGRPGQFVMVGLPALAAPPISVSRFNPDGLELTIRAAGAATRQLCNLERGASVSLRGPLGRGWPVEEAEGRDVLIVTGGIGLAPLRPLIDELLRRRDRIARFHLAYGARTPGDRLFAVELDQLASSGEIEISQTVDRAGPEWLGRVGVVTQVIDRAFCSCDRTIAFICGPERMMEATVRVLHERGVPDERIFVTLERHMDCGVGLCGHCQLGKFFVCRDGPVFSLAELGPAFGQEGL